MAGSRLAHWLICPLFPCFGREEAKPMRHSLTRPKLRLLSALVLFALALAGVCALFLYPRVLHTAQPVNVAVFSPDGKTLATGHTVLVEDKHKGWAYGSGEIQLRSVQSGLVTRTYPFFYRSTKQLDASRNGGPVGWLAFSPDGKLLMASNQHGGDDDAVGILDIASGRWLLSLRGVYNGGAPFCNRPVGFSPDSRRAFVLRFAAHDRSRTRAAEDSREQFSQITRDSSLVTYNCATGSVIRSIPHILQPGEWPQGAVLLSDGAANALATVFGNASRRWTDSGKLILLDTRTGKRLRTVETGQDTNSLAASPHLPLVAQASSNGTLLLWDTHSPKAVQCSPARDNGVWTVALSPDGKTMAGIGSRNNLYLWDTARRAPVRLLSFNTPWVSSLAFSPDGTLLAQTGPGNAVKLYRVW